MGDILSTNKTVNLLQESMNALARRHEMLANNIANVDTPNYKRKDMDFQQVLKDSIQKQESSSIPLATTSQGHISGLSRSPSSGFSITNLMEGAYRADQNSVDIDKEVVEMNKNSLLYNSATNLLNNEFFLLRYAIEEGRR